MLCEKFVFNLKMPSQFGLDVESDHLWLLLVKNQMAMKNFDGLCMVLILHLLTLSCLKLCFDL